MVLDNLIFFFLLVGFDLNREILEIFLLSLLKNYLGSLTTHLYEKLYLKGRSLVFGISAHKCIGEEFLGFRLDFGALLLT
jgi:hypothetical protein